MSSKLIVIIYYIRLYLCIYDSLGVIFFYKCTIKVENNVFAHKCRFNVVCGFGRFLTLNVLYYMFNMAFKFVCILQHAPINRKVYTYVVYLFMYIRCIYIYD